MPKSSQAPSPKLMLPKTLLNDVRSLIDTAKQRTAAAVNAALGTLYWHIGNRILKDLLQHNRAVYGDRLIESLADKLTADYGSGFSRTALFYMVRFAEVFPDEQIVHTLCGQLSWSHLRILIHLNDPLQREFYTQLCRTERWSVRTLQTKIQSLLYERTAVSKKPAALIQADLNALKDDDRLSPDLVFRDPYFLDFLGLKNTFSERDLESAILRELESFLLELGSDFAFIARQKRITLDREDYYIDLLFYHRRLRRMVAIDLKLGKFQAADKGQMELYLRWLDKHERLEGEDSPIGLILCTGKSSEHIELLELEKSGIRVAEYLTVLPPRSVLEKKLRDALATAQRRLSDRSEAP